MGPWPLRCYFQSSLLQKLEGEQENKASTQGRVQGITKIHLD